MTDMIDKGELGAPAVANQTTGGLSRFLAVSLSATA